MISYHDIRMNTLTVSLLSALFLSSTGCEITFGAESDSDGNLPDISGYPVVGIGQISFFNKLTSISEPASGERLIDMQCATVD